MPNYELCLLDCSSIQKYVFGSNKLKTNIGASQNVADIYDKWIQKTLTADPFDLKDHEIDLSGWENDDPELLVLNKQDLLVEAGYIGGGNALLIFRKNEKIDAKKFIQQWSLNLLINFPGIVPAAAILETVKIDKDIGKSILDSLFKKLQKTKSAAIPQTVLPRHGITAECKKSGFSVEKLYKPYKDESEDLAWVSSVIASKLAGYKSLRKNKSEEKFIQSYQIEKLGQTEAQNQIAVVHIDGNSMGDTFEKCNSLYDRRKLSHQVDMATREAWKQTKKDLIANLDNFAGQKIIKKEVEKSSQTILPIRSIILNGDDITFICNAQLAFWLTEKFLNALSKQPIPNIKDNQTRMSACAGIAIVKTKFPFYRAYMLAEELCAKAKLYGRPNNESWLDFEILYGGLSGDLTDMRQKKYDIGADSLLWRPWRVAVEKDQTADNTNRDFTKLKNAVRQLQDDESKKRWPRSKVKGFAQSLAQGRLASEAYYQTLLPRGLTIDKLGFGSNLWIDHKNIDREKNNENSVHCRTPFFDIFQVLEFYPKICKMGDKSK